MNISNIYFENDLLGEYIQIAEDNESKILFPDCKKILSKEYKLDVNISKTELIANFEQYSDNNEEQYQEYYNYFKKMITSYEYLYISAKFKTNFIFKRNPNNYGLKITFWTTDLTQSEYTITLDLNAFNGNPYNLTNWTTQSTLIYMPVLSRVIYAIKSIELFYTPNENEYNTSVEEYIAIKDIALNMVNSTIPYNYSSSIGYTNNIFSDDQTKNVFTPNLYFNGYTLDEKYIYDVEWYYRNNKLNYDSSKNKYYQIADYGWSKMNTSAKELSITIDKSLKYNNNYYFLNNFQYEIDIKCIFKYKVNNSIFETDYITLKNNKITDIIIGDIEIIDQEKSPSSVTSEHILQAKIKSENALKLVDSYLYGKWYFKENGWNYFQDIGKGIQSEEALNVLIPYTEPEITQINAEATLISNIDLTKKLYLWNGTFSLFCDVYLVQKDMYGNNIETYLTTKVIQYDKNISLYEFEKLFQTYLKERNNFTIGDNYYAKKAIDWCKSCGIFSKDDWKSPITNEELVQAVYNGYENRVEVKERNKNNPYTQEMSERLIRYYAEQVKNTTINSNFQSSWNYCVKNNYISDIKPNSWITREELVTILYRIFSNETELVENQL